MKKMFFINLFLALLVIFLFSVDTNDPVTAASDSYYVSPDGSDRNPGTEEKPWATIQRAAESAAPGSTIYIKAGTYYERVDIKVSGASAEQPVVFRNYENDKVVIDGSKTPAAEQEDIIRISNRSHIRLIGLEIVNNTGEESDSLLTGIGIWGKGQGIEIRDCRIHHIGYTGTTDDAGGQAIAVYGGDADEPLSGLVIDGNEIWDIRCGTKEAVALGGNLDGFEMTNNYVHDTNNTGIALIGDVRNGFVGYNQLGRNSRTENPCYRDGDFGAGGIRTDGAGDVVIAYNICTENDIGIEIGNRTGRKAASGIIVKSNLIYGNNACGVRAGGSDMNSGWTEDCEFLNNTLYGNDTKKQGQGEIHIAKSRDLLFGCNIVYTGSDNLAVTTENFGEKYIYHISFNHNLYYGPGGSRGLRFTGTDTGLVGLNMWKFKTKQDSASRIADPGFADAAKGDFRLLPDSPAIDFGNPAYVPEAGETDFAGNPRVGGRAVDCGAYEFH